MQTINKNMDKQLFSIGKNKVLAKTVKAILFFFSAVYLLAPMGLMLQGRILFMDGLFPYEASLCVFASILLFTLSIKEVRGIPKC